MCTIDKVCGEDDDVYDELWSSCASFLSSVTKNLIWIFTMRKGPRTAHETPADFTEQVHGLVTTSYITNILDNTMLPLLRGPDESFEGDCLFMPKSMVRMQQCE